MISDTRRRQVRRAGSLALNLAGLLLIVAIVVPVVGYAVPQVVGAEQGYVVMSGSMEPAIPTGSVIYAYDRDPQSIGEGDIIAFNTEGKQYEVTTHRVVDVTRVEGARMFVTKGDANDNADRRPVPPDAVVGVVPQLSAAPLGVVPQGIRSQLGIGVQRYQTPLHVPYLGRFLLFTQQPKAIVLLVFVPAGLLVLTELWGLYREVNGGGNGDSDAADATETGQSASRDETPPPREGDD